MFIVMFLIIAIIIFFVWLILLKHAEKIGSFVFKYMIDPILNIFKGEN